VRVQLGTARKILTGSQVRCPFKGSCKVIIAPRKSRITCVRGLVYEDVQGGDERNSTIHLQENHEGVTVTQSTPQLELETQPFTQPTHPYNLQRRV
jgi:hypothetical protein